MATYEVSLTSGSRDILATDWFKFACVAFCAANAALLFAAWHASDGTPTDFVSVWAAGRLALDGQPQAAYDPSAHKAVEDLAAGFAFRGYYAWLYPPSFLPIATVLALLPYGVAHVIWPPLTACVYLTTIRAIVRHRTTILLCAAFPAIVANIAAEQNGFLSAALLGGALILMERRPVLSGCLLGLLTYKPQLGLLIPLALIAGGQWRVLGSAAAVATALAAASWAAFGSATWTAFGNSALFASRAFLADDAANWHKLQTVFGLVRSLGGSESIAWSFHAAMLAANALLIWVIWRRPMAFEVKAAALAAASLLATPYLYAYDLVVLAIPIAFLIRLGQTSGFLPGELAGITAASLLVLVIPLVAVPIGVAATVIVLLLVARRALPIGRPVGVCTSGI
jgi:arabinofuranan 3-O-arabinosyltransferase